MAINCEIVKQLIAICLQTDEPVTLINIHKLGHIKLKFEIMVLRPNFSIKDEGGWQLFFFFLIIKMKEAFKKNKHWQS